MDLELTHIGQTLALGGFVIYSIIWLRKLYGRSGLRSLFHFSREELPLLEMAVAIAIVFATGIIIEDISKDLTSGRNSYIGNSLNCVLDSDKELRVKSLFVTDRLSANFADISENSLSTSVLRLGSPPDTIKPHIEDLKVLLKGPKTTIDGREYVAVNGEEQVRKLQDSVNQVYYHAKNSVYQNPTYFNDLNEIATKIDFTRSLLFMCLSFAVVYFVAGGISFIPYISKRYHFTSSRRGSLFKTGVLFIIGIIFSGMAYRLESNTYNLHVFGYYISQKLDPTKKDDK